jgi:hypothetical protein
MKNSKFLLTLLLLAVVFGWLFFFKWKAKKSGPINVPISTNATVQIAAISPATNQQPFAVANTNKPDKEEILKQYHQGMISQAQAMQQLALAQNQNLDLYGKVIDQYGQPVSGAKIQGDVVISEGFMHQRDEVHLTQTDEGGNFSYLGFNGSGLGIWPQKAGYFYNLKLPSKRPSNYNPDPNNPVIFTIWKLRGAEPLISYSIDSKIPFDGTPVTFDIASQKIDNNGDFRVSLKRSPLMVRRSGEGFDWNLKVEMIHGGLEGENDPYPYWAPDNGYNSFFIIDMSSNNVAWYSHVTEDFYIKNAAGQYGLMHANIYTALTPVRVQFDFTFNPSGSQNLEPASQ